MTTLQPRPGRALMLSLATFSAFLLLAALSLLSHAPVHADPETIYVDATAGGANDGSSWSDAHTSLQDALDRAADGDEVWVAGGVYYPDEGANQTDGDRSSSFQPPSGVALYGGFAGGETERQERDWETNPTVLSGDIDQNDATDGRGVVTETVNISGSNAYHVVNLNGHTIPITESTRLDGFIVTAGNADGGSSGNAGGGLYCYGLGWDCDPVFANVTFSGNYAGASGGAIFLFHSEISLTNVVIDGNSAGSHGGGISSQHSSPTLTDVIISNNVADTFGGGMESLQQYPTLTNVTFSKNHAGVNGGGFYNDSPSTLSNVTFSENSAGTNGGGMYNRDHATLSNAIFSGNRAATDGGAIYFDYSTITLVNVTVSGNSAGNNGGGFYTNLNTPEFINTIFWNNQDQSGVGTADASVYGNAPIISYSLVQSHNPPGDGNLDGTDPANDPLFVTPVDPTNAPTGAGDLRLQPGSPAIDAGDNDAVLSGVTTDLDGNDRILDGDDDLNAVVDMGAYETELVVEEDALSVALSTSSLTVDEGETMTFTVTMSNTALARVEPITVTDSMSGTLAGGLTLLAGEVMTYTYGWTADDGPRTAVNVVTVTSAQTNPVSATVQVQVLNVAPAVTAPADQMVVLGREANITAAVSDPGNDVQGATVDWGDGNGPQAATLHAGTIYAAYTYAQIGAFTVTVCADDGDAQGCDSLTVTVVAAGVVVSPTGTLTTTENGGAATLTISLTHQPLDTVSISLVSSDPGEGTVSPDTVTFDASNWQTAQTVTVTGVDDDVHDGDVVYTIVISISTEDPVYDGFEVNDVVVVNLDDDPAFIYYIPQFIGAAPEPED